MARKVFVSYKYKDSGVQSLSTTTYPPTWPSDYVDYIERYVLAGNIYKGEKQDEDLSAFSEDYIWRHLKDKMYDSTVTAVLISPNMKEPGKWQSSQWIPWEISYSLRKTTRGGRTSQRNSIVAVILPDNSGSYSYFNKANTFPILRDNINNGYIFVTTWSDFKQYPNYCIGEADKHRDSTPEWKISISV